MWLNVIFGVIIFASFIVIASLLTVGYTKSGGFDSEGIISNSTPTILALVSACIMWFVPVFLVGGMLVSYLFWGGVNSNSFVTYGIVFIMCIAATALTGTAYGLGTSDSLVSQDFKTYTLVSLIYLAVIDILLLIGFVMSYQRNNVMKNVGGEVVTTTVTQTVVN